MTLEIYCTRNKKSGNYGSLDLQKFTEEEAKENYKDAYLESTASNKVLYQELELYHLGTYDTKTGKIVALDAPVFLLDLGTIEDGRKEDSGKTC